MKIYLSDQRKHLQQHLESLKKQSAIIYQKHRLKEKVTSITINTNKTLEDLDFFWDYRIFPENIMTHQTQWAEEKRTMKIGDTIVQQAYLPPSKQCSLKMVFGVRIKQIIKEENRIGFSYETLNGHVEMGESFFTIEKIKEDTMIFKIHTFSKPGSLLTRAFGPIFAVPYQTFCTAQALKHVKKQLKLKG